MTLFWKEGLHHGKYHQPDFGMFRHYSRNISRLSPYEKLSETFCFQIVDVDDSIAPVQFCFMWNILLLFEYVNNTLTFPSAYHSYVLISPIPSYIHLEIRQHLSGNMCRFCLH